MNFILVHFSLSLLMCVEYWLEYLLKNILWLMEFGRKKVLAGINIFLQMQYHLVIDPNVLTAFVFQMNVLFLITYLYFMAFKSLKMPGKHFICTAELFCILNFHCMPSSALCSALSWAAELIISTLNSLILNQLLVCYSFWIV